MFIQSFVIENDILVLIYKKLWVEYHFATSKYVINKFASDILSVKYKKHGEFML